MAIRDDLALITWLGMASSTGKDSLDRCLRCIVDAKPVGSSAATGTFRFPLFRAKEACRVKSAGFITDTGQASDASNYRTVKLSKNDGVGGADTDFDSKGGVSAALTADRRTAFTMVESTDTLAAGDWLIGIITSTGTGAALGDISFEYEIWLD